MLKLIFKLTLAFGLLTGSFISSFGQQKQEQQQRPDPFAGSETMKQLQNFFVNGDMSRIKTKMIDSMGFHLVPLIHFKEDTALTPLLLELYIKYQAKYREPYVSIQINFEPTGKSWIDFMKYRFSITLAQGSVQAFPQEIIKGLEKDINTELAKLGTLEDMLSKSSGIFERLFSKLGKVKINRQGLPIVRFYMAQNTRYGFDTPSDQPGVTYESFNRGDSIVLVPWKSLGTLPDEVMAVVEMTDSTNRLDSIIFRDGKDMRIFPKDPKAQPFVLSVTGKGNKNEDEITAYYKTTDEKGKPAEAAIGKLQTISYTPEKKNVVLIPVGNVSVTDIQADLNKIYGQAVFEWTVTIAPSFNISTALYKGAPGENTISIETGMFKSYTGETQAIIDAYKEANKTDNSTCYLFVTSIPNDKGFAGYMPLNAQFGFIFTSGNTLSHTIAHELGHALGMSHPYDATDPRMKTEENLMAYSGKKRLNKEQWREMHDVDWGLGWGQKVEDGAYAPFTEVYGLTVNKIDNLAQYNLENKPLSFVSPTGQIITLPANAFDLRFSRSTGALIGFTIGTQRFLPHSFSQNNQFAGYRISLKDEPFNDSEYTKNLQYPINIFLAQPGQAETNCNVILEVGTLKEYNAKWDHKGGIKNDPSNNILALFDGESLKEHSQQYSLYNCAQKPMTKLVIASLQNLIKTTEDYSKLQTIISILDAYHPVMQEEYSRLYNIQDYQDHWQNPTDFSGFAISNNTSIDEWLSDFMKFKEDEDYFLNSITSTTNDEKLEAYAYLITEGNTQLLSIENRKKLLDAFCNNATLLKMEESVVLKLLINTPKYQIQDLLNYLADKQSEKLLWLNRKIDDGIWITRDNHNHNYHMAIRNLLLKLHDLPDITIDNINNYVANEDYPDRPIKTYFQIQDKNQKSDPGDNFSDDFYYYKIDQNNIIVNAKQCLEREVLTVSTTDGYMIFRCKTSNPFINNVKLNPYDLVLLINGEDVKYLDSEQKPINTIVVPAFFFHYLSREQSQQTWLDITNTTLTIAAFAIPGVQIVNGLRIGGALGASVIRWSVAEVAFNATSLFVAGEEFSKWCDSHFDKDQASVIKIGANIVFVAGSVFTGIKGATKALEAKNALFAAATIEKIDVAIQNGDLASILNKISQDDLRKIRTSLLDHASDIRARLGYAANLDLLRIATRYDDLLKIGMEYSCLPQIRTFIGLGGDIAVNGKVITLKYNNQVIGVLDGTLNPSKLVTTGDALDDIVIDGYRLVKNEEGVAFVKISKGADELVGKYDWGLVKRYFQHIQEVTGRPVPQVQIDKLKEALRAKEYKKLTSSEYTAHTKIYSSKKEQMIKDWEKYTGQKWPVDENGRRYQLHHIIEQQYGGPHEWWNAHPARFPDQHQGGIHGAGSPARELFK